MLKRYIRQMFVAALYAVCTLIIPAASFGIVQFRISEAMMLLALADFDYVYGLTLGCILANLMGVITGANPLGIMDIIFGSCATFISAVMMHRFADKKLWKVPLLSLLMPIIYNGIIIGLELAIIYNGDMILHYWPIYGSSVVLGEAAVMLPIGIPLYFALKERFFHD